jgi:hypothetical protein
LRPVARDIAEHFLPVMAANQEAVALGARRFAFESFGARFVTPVSPYRAMRLADLQARWRTLPGDAQALLSGVLGAPGVLAARPPLLPERPKRADRAWRPIAA